jgi:NADH-quinone oxidoreductase subunit J
VAAGMLAVTRRNAVASVMWLVAAFLGMAVLFVGMDAGFIGTIQVLVYAGAILVLFLFVIMLLNLTPTGLARIERPRLKVLGVGAALLFTLIIAVVAGASKQWTSAPRPLDAGRREFGSTLSVADRLLYAHMLPFEVASVLLLVAIVGAVALTKRKL